MPEIVNEPEPIKEEAGKKLWIIEGYKIWAATYVEALQLLPLIKSF